MIGRHWHWEFVAYNGEPDAEKLRFAVEITVIGYLSEADARVAVQDVVVRQQYALRRVWECGSCEFRERISETMSEIASKA